MNVIVTNNSIDYSSGFMKVNSLKEAYSVVGNIDFLVYHKSNESEDSKAEYLTKLKGKVHTFVYIRSKDCLDKTVQMLIVGSGGKYFDDEFFLENASELSRLIKNLDEVTAIAELGGVNVLSDFFNRYLKNGSASFSSGYLSVVKEAVSNMIAEYKQKDLELVQLSETATDLFSNSLELVSKIDTERESLKQIVTNLEVAREQGQLDTVVFPTASTGVFYFPQVSYLKEKNIVRIKEVGNFAYLTSFMLGFRLYLERIKYVRPKLVFIMPQGNLYETLYKDYKWVTQSTIKTMGNYFNPVVFTNYPNREVLVKLLDDSDYDTFIIVDRVKNSEKHILNSKGGAIRYAVPSESILERVKLKSISCFCNSNVKNTLFSVQTDTQYPAEQDQRERFYLREYSQAYESLYNIRR